LGKVVKEVSHKYARVVTDPKHEPVRGGTASGHERKRGGRVRLFRDQVKDKEKERGYKTVQSANEDGKETK